VELATALAHGTDVDAALEALARAGELAREANAPALEAGVAEATALVHDGQGRSEVAASYLREALRIAEIAGDAETAGRCRRALPGEASEAAPRAQPGAA
jgi:hypothetical protein